MNMARFENCNKTKRVPLNRRQNASGRAGTFSFVLLCCIATATASFGAGDDDLEISKEFEQDVKEVSSLTQKRNISEFEKRADLLHSKWHAKSENRHGKVMLRLCESVGSGRFGVSRQLDLARKYALLGLENADKLELETELALVGYMMTDTVTSRAPQGQNWANIRRTDAMKRLHAWKRLLDAIDPKWNPKDMPLRNVPAPVGAGLDAGGSPGNIRDPKLRAEYEAAIESNKQKAEIYTKQASLRRQLKEFAAHAEGYIVGAYSRPPLDSKEIDQLLQTHLKDENVRSRIMELVRKSTGEK